MLHAKIKKFISGNTVNGSSLLVVGAPGTGKTYQLLKLVEYALVKKKMDPKKLLVFCFNRRWAKIIREQTAGMIGNSFFEIPVTTFFSFCNKLIEHDNLYGSPPVILNAPGQWKLLSEVINGINNKKKYPLTTRFISGSSYVSRNYIQEVFDFILRSQENLVKPEDFLNRLTAGSDPVLFEMGGIYLKYLEILRENGLYNYGRLLTDAVEALAPNLKPADKCVTPYDLVIVDELQEINRAQLEIANMVSGNTRRIYFGNDDECTYSFRGSIINNFSRIYSSLSTAESSRSNILHLNTNFRSSWEINEICRRFISLNQYRTLKDNEVKVNKPANKIAGNGSDITMKTFSDVLEEAGFIARYIKKLIFIDKIRAENICIIVKGRGYKTAILENILQKNAILFSRRGSRTILDNKYVQYLLDLAGLINLLFFKQPSGGPGKNINPLEPDKLPEQINTVLLRLLASDISGINPIYIKRLAATGEDLWKIIQCKDRGPGGNTGKKIDENATELYKFTESIKKFLQHRDITAFDFFTLLFKDENIGILKKLAQDKKIRDYSKAGILNIVGDFMQSVKIFCSSNTAKNSIMDYLEFLEDIIESGFLEEIEESTKDIKSTGLINILSYHHCKGLEFDAVFLPFINKDYLPSVFKDNQLYDTQVFNFLTEGKTLPGKILGKKHLEDERKLFYTGMTRAKKFLIITAASGEPGSLFFEEASALRNQLKKKSLNTDARNDRSCKKTLLYNTARQEEKSKNNDKRLPDSINEMNYKWLERKRAVAGLLRLYNKKYINFDSFSRRLIYLKFAYPPGQWWLLKDITLNSKNPSVLFPMSFSYTALATYMQCPRKYKYRYFFGLETPENIHATVGLLYHKIINRFLGQEFKDLSWESLENIIKTEFNAKEFAYSHLFNELLDRALKDFRSYYEKYAAGFSGNAVLEKKFTCNIGSKKINGRIDLIDIIDKDTAHLVDFKSGDKNSSYADPESEIQLPLYRLAIEKSNDFKMLENKKLILKYIFLGSENCSEMVFMHENFDFAGFEERISGLMQKIVDEEFRQGPENDYTCSNCQFRLICKGKIEKG